MEDVRAVRLSAAIEMARTDATARAGQWRTVVDDKTVPAARTRMLALLDIADAVDTERAAGAMFMASKSRVAMAAWAKSKKALDDTSEAFRALMEEGRREGQHV